MSVKICSGCGASHDAPCCPERDMVDERAYLAGLKRGYSNAVDVAIFMRPDAERILNTLIELAETTPVQTQLSETPHEGKGADTLIPPQSDRPHGS